MQSSYLSRHAVALCAAAALFAGCGGSQPPIGTPGAMPRSVGTIPHILPASGYEVIYKFRRNDGDGVHPYSGLINVNGTLYGTTTDGGAYDHGSVYSVTATGEEDVVYSFRHGPTGDGPYAGLIDVNGKLYGTAALGGAHGDGTIYSVTTTGTQKVVYSFSGSDGARPTAGLINVKGRLYGTTLWGGGSGCGGAGCGTVFSVTTAGAERVLHSFRGGSDGANPSAELLNVNGTLYGTTGYGGSGCGSYGCGTVFSITTSGKERVLHSFNVVDGATPAAGLVNVNGILYGTTFVGGGKSSECFGTGCGVVFSVTKTGKEKVLYRFRGSSDGSWPVATLLDVKGTLYGTTTDGGAYYRPPNCCGTLFSVTTSGKETVLHSFGNGTDGSHPSAGLTDFGGTLYGTTAGGGAHGAGTVFSFNP